MKTEEFEWDRDKNDRNRRVRGFGFEFAVRIFDGDVLERQDLRRNYGEARIVATGLVEGKCLTLVYTLRGNRRRVISARRADRKERYAYSQTQPG
jgi:uncharacterized DUF497 family protein